MPPRKAATEDEKDKQIAQLKHENEMLMREVKALESSASKRQKALQEADKAEESAIRASAALKEENGTAPLLGGKENARAISRKASMEADEFEPALKREQSRKHWAMAKKGIKVKMRNKPHTMPVSEAEKRKLEKAMEDITRTLKLAAGSKLKQAGVGFEGLTTYEGQSIRKNYLTALEACRDFLSDDTSYDGSELDLGITVFSWENSARASHRVCITLSLAIAAVAVGVAAAFQMWALVISQERFEHDKSLLMDSSFLLSNASSSAYELLHEGEGLVVASADGEFEFDALEFMGWPDHKLVKNLVGGAVLGLIFGFLDNFGLFYGMGALDAIFYYMGSLICAGLVRVFRRPNIRGGAEETHNEFESIAADMHVVTNDLMAGLGNTFSDFLGVALGSAALEIAKAGLGVEPSFWPMDLASMVFGCLLGVFLPALIKHSELLGGEHHYRKLAGMAWFGILLLFATVLLAGIPYEWGFTASAACLATVILMLFVLMIFFPCMGKTVFNKAGHAIAREVEKASLKA